MDFEEQLEECLDLKFMECKNSDERNKWKREEIKDFLLIVLPDREYMHLYNQSKNKSLILVKGNKKTLCVPCIVEAIEEKIYMSEKTFKRYSKILKHKKVNVKALETETKKAEVLNHELIIRGKKLDINTQREISKKADLLYRGKYVFSSKDNLIHDKNCRHVKDIPLEEFNVTNKLLPEKQPCMDCYRQMVVRSVYLHEYEDIYEHYWFFSKAQASRMQFWKFLTDDEMHMRMENKTTLNVRCREDLFKIIYDEENDVFKLLHNNYKVTENLQREFFDTFHEQETKITYLLGLLAYIKNYTWDMSHMETKVLETTEESISEEIYEEDDVIESLKHTKKDKVATGYNPKKNMSHEDILADILGTKK